MSRVIESSKKCSECLSKIFSLILDKKGKGRSTKTDKNRQLINVEVIHLRSYWIIRLVFLNNKTVTSDKRKLKQSTNNFDDRNKRSFTMNGSSHQFHGLQNSLIWCNKLIFFLFHVVCRQLFAEVQLLVFVINFFFHNFEDEIWDNTPRWQGFDFAPRGHFGLQHWPYNSQITFKQSYVSSNVYIKVPLAQFSSINSANKAIFIKIPVERWTSDK